MAVDTRARRRLRYFSFKKPRAGEHNRRTQVVVAEMNGDGTRTAAAADTAQGNLV